MIRDPLARRFTKVYGGVHLRAQMCPFCISESAGRIELEFGMCLVTNQLGFLQKLGVVHSYTCARASLFLISETAGWIALKFGVWLGDH